MAIQMRKIPKAPLSTCPPEYARLLTQGIDTWQEAYSLHLLPEFVDLLEASKKAAEELSHNLDATVEITLNGEKFKAHATGAKGGFNFRLESDDFLILVASPRRDWCLSVRYLSAGLWEHGVEALRMRIHRALAPYSRPRSNDYVRVTRVDYCFDFYSPAFAKEFAPRMAENIVIHSNSKSALIGKFEVWSRGARGETLTIGGIQYGQAQIYNKITEITEASGKEWMRDVWERSLGKDFQWNGKPHSVFRLECRMSKAFLKERNIRRPHEVKSALDSLVAEILYTRRLALPNFDDSHRHRWPLHPLWSEAVRQVDADGFVPIGRKVTDRRKVLLDNAEKSLAGAMRSASVLATGDFSDGNVIDLARRARARITSDPNHLKKVQAAQSRYSDVDEAK